MYKIKYSLSYVRVQVMEVILKLKRLLKKKSDKKAII